MSFGAIADDYDRLRPEPPDAAVDWLLPEHCQVAVDLAAGTGLLSRALVRKVAQVIAVEPDERMAAVLRGRSPELRVVEGRGEAIPLPDASADGVFVSSAWHWMDPGRAVPEIGRVLRDGGRFGLIWTGRDRQVGWLRDIDRLRAVGREDRQATGEHGARGEARRWSGHREVTLPDGAVFGNVETAAFSFTRAMTISEIVDMLATYSGVITASPQDRAAGLARARAALQERFGSASEIDVPMRSWCWRADRAARAEPPPARR
jgi:SAM-dependent methyltransferase